MSYAHDDLSLAREIADALRNIGLSVFDVASEPTAAWGQSIDVYLPTLFPENIPAAMVLLSAHYSKSAWCTRELKLVVERIAENPDAGCVLPVRLDETPLPPLVSELLYIDSRQTTPTEVASLTKKRLEQWREQQHDFLARLSDEELMQRVALKRDTKAFDVLYERFYPLVVTYASQHLDRSSAEETAAEVMIRLWQSAERFDPKKPLRPWLFAVARNALVSFWRRRSAGIPIPSAEEETELQGPATQDIRPLVSEALKSLPEAERHIIVLTYMDGLTSAEIAQRLGVPQAAVSSRQHRALQKMRKALTELRKSG